MTATDTDDGDGSFEFLGSWPPPVASNSLDSNASPSRGRGARGLCQDLQAARRAQDEEADESIRE